MCAEIPYQDVEEGGDRTSQYSYLVALHPVQNLVMRFFYFFKVVFVKGALPRRHHQNSLEGFAAF